MECTVVCGCGKILAVSEGMAGASLSCDCGATVVMPPLGNLPSQAISEAVSPLPFSPCAMEIKLEPGPPQEMIAPTPVSMRTQRGAKSDRRTALMATLTRDALWIQDIWQLRCLALQDFSVERRSSRKELGLTPLNPESSGEKLSLTFTSAAEADRWNDKIQELQSRLNPDAPLVRRTVPEGVALVRRAPEVPHVALGSVAYLHRTATTADRGVQLRAGIRGANAIVDLQRTKCPEMESGARRVNGLAVHVQDADSLNRLRWTWYTEELSTLVWRMLLLVFIEAFTLFLAAAFFQGKTPMSAATGESLTESLASAGVGLGLFFAWPLVLIVLLRILRWRELLRSVGIAVVAVTTVRGLIVVLGHLLAVLTTGADLADSKIGYLADPVDWALMVFGVVLCVRAWQLHSRSRQILPEEALVSSLPRKLWSRGLLGTTLLFALFCLGVAGTARYDESCIILQKGVDPRREQEASRGLNEGAALANKGNLAAAEESFQRSLRLWEALTAGGQAPSTYRINLAVTLIDLGWIRLRQARHDEAETYYSRAVAVADQLGKDLQLDPESRRTLDNARRTLASLREEKAFKRDEQNFALLSQKVQEADRKYEEAEVRDQKGEPDAERLYREAIALWEEVLPHATAEAYRKNAVAQLSDAWLRLGELQRLKADRTASEASLKKAIDYAEKAVALDPSRPLLKHNLGVARRSLELLHDQAFQDEIGKLGRTGRFADTVDLFTRGVDELDRRVRAGKDLDLAVPSLAHRLDRFAWFLAHCPDLRTRSTKCAVEHARRATELRPGVGDYWYTLAMVQYRNGNWRDSLLSLEKVKAIQGEFAASDWLVSAMDLYQLDRKEEARAALRKASEWIAEQTRKAETDVGLRLEFELMRPAIEDLLQEARELLGGKARVG